MSPGIIFLVVWVVCGVLAVALTADSEQLSILGFFLLIFLMGPIAIAFMLGMLGWVFWEDRSSR